MKHIKYLLVGIIAMLIVVALIALVAGEIYCLLMPLDTKQHKLLFCIPIGTIVLLLCYLFGRELCEEKTGQDGANETH